MFKILLIILILGGLFAYTKFGNPTTKMSYPQFPNSLSEINLNSVKDWSLDQLDKYLPDASSQTAVLGAKAKNESVILLIEAAKKLKPEEFKTLQQFICEPSKQP